MTHRRRCRKKRSQTLAACRPCTIESGVHLCGETAMAVPLLLRPAAAATAQAVPEPRLQPSRRRPFSWSTTAAQAVAGSGTAWALAAAVDEEGGGLPWLSLHTTVFIHNSDCSLSGDTKIRVLVRLLHPWASTVLLNLLLPLRRRAVVTTCPRKVKHRITASLRVPRLAIPLLPLTVSTRKSMFARMPPSFPGIPMSVRAL